MKRYNIKYYTIVIVTILFGFTACTEYFEDLNKNPYGVTQEEASRDAYSQGASMKAIQSWVLPTNVNTAQFTECLLGGNFGRYFSDSNPGFNNKNFATYIPEPGWNRVLFNDFIPEIYPNINMLKSLTEDEVLLSVADICKVASIHRITDAYGPIPYSKIGSDGELQAAYDSQEDVYRTMLGELSDAITKLTNHKTEKFSPNADKVYGGDVVKWIKFANSLKLRLAMRIVYADPTLSQQMAEEACNHEIGTMETNDDNAMMKASGKDGNPFYVIMYLYNGGDSRVCADLTSFMNGYNDARREKYFTKSTFTSSQLGQNGFIGLRSGIEVTDQDHKYTNYNVSPSSPLMWMNAAEVAFLKAEAKLRGWNVGGKTAQAYYEEGIRLSFDQWGASDADSYIADNTSKPQSYSDPLGLNTYSGPISTITIAWDDQADFEKNLERVITQKWIAIFPLGLEAWAEHRRTGYPQFMPVVVNNSGGVIDDDMSPRRLYYPQEEITTNGPNVREAISKYLKGPDNMATRVWWDNKNK